MGKSLPTGTLDTFELMVRIERARERSQQLIAQTRHLRRESRAIQASAALKRLQLSCLAALAVQREHRCRERIRAIRPARKTG